MKDQNKMKAQLIQELAELRQSFAELKKTETKSKHIKEDLKASEKKYRFLYQNSPAINIIVGTDGLIKDINKSVVVNLGYSRDEAIGKYVLDFVVPEQKEKVSTQLAKDFKGEYTPEIDVDVYAKDRSIHTILSSPGNAILKEKGQLVGILVTGIDITEHKQAEEKIKAKSLFLESLIQQSPLPTFVMDSKGFNVMVNEAFLKFYAVPNKEMVLGRNALTEPANVKQDVVKYFEKALSGKIVEIPEIEFVSPYKNKKVITRGRLFPILDPTGALTNVVVMQEDITERKQAEEALIESEEKYRIIVEMAPDAIGTVNLMGIVTSCNDAFTALTGFSKNEIVGKHFLKLPYMKAKDIPKYLKMFTSLLGGKLPRPFEISWIHKDGSSHLNEVRVGLMKKDNKILGVQVIGRDITESKRAEEALRESEERFRFMAENTGDVLYRLKYDTMNFDYLSPAVSMLTGYTTEEINIIGFKSLIKQTVIPGVPDVLPEELARKRKEGKTGEWRAEYEIITKDGKTKWLGDHSFPWKDDSGKIVGSTGILQDITKRKRAEEDLRKRLEELEIYYNATMGREGRIIELKQQVNELFVQLGKEKKYDV